MNTQEYRSNRAQFPRDELAKHSGQWVAFSPDGRNVVAGDEDLERLGECLTAQGEDLQQVVFEYVPGPGDDSTLDRVESL
jgi:hypothetical protein